MSAAIDAEKCGVWLLGVGVGAETAAAAVAVAAGDRAAAAGPPATARCCRMLGVADCDCSCDCRCGMRAPEGRMSGQRAARGQVEVSATQIAVAAGSSWRVAAVKEARSAAARSAPAAPPAVAPFYGQLFLSAAPFNCFPLEACACLAVQPLSWLMVTCQRRLRRRSSWLSGSAHRCRFLAFKCATRNSSSSGTHAHALTADGHGRARSRAASQAVGRRIEAQLTGRGLQLVEDAAAKMYSLPFQ